MTSVKVRLYTYRATCSGTYPLVFQVIQHRVKKVIFSSYHLPAECFDKKSGHVVSRRSHKLKDCDEINSQIDGICKKLQLTIDILERRESEYGASDVVDLYKSFKESCRVKAYMEKLTVQFEQEQKYATLNSYKSTLHRIQKFSGKKELLFSDITPRWLNNFITWLKKSGVKDNTVNFYCRVLRATYNRAHREGIEGAISDSPFEAVTFGTVKTAKRAIDGEAIKRIAHAKVKNDRHMELARDLFLFSFYSRGMPFIDMACLRYKDIIGDAIYYNRHKTGQPMRVKLVPQINNLIEKYRNKGKYILPILHVCDRGLYSQYRTELRKFNNSLKMLSSALDLKVPLTSYVSRHSWATLAHNDGAPLSVISQSLGHTSEKITDTYLKALDPVIVDSLNEQMSFKYF